MSHSARCPICLYPHDFDDEKSCDDEILEWQRQIEEKSVELKKYQRAFKVAKTLIESYQFDIKNSEWIGVDLVEKGFCQGEAYLKYEETIKHESGLQKL